MSDKPFAQLNELDRIIRRACPVGPGQEGVRLTIEYVAGFEMFNTRPYHNYETWGSGYRVSGENITVQAEDLDDALRLWMERAQNMPSPPPHPAELLSTPADDAAIRGAVAAHSAMDRALGGEG
jgi:hypothetical protein